MIRCPRQNCRWRFWGTHPRWPWIG